MSIQFYIQGADDAVVAQRRVDGDRGPRWLHQVLAEQHEQREDVPGGLDDYHVVKKLLTKVDLTHLNKIFAGINPMFRLTKRRSGESRSVPLTPSSPPAVTMAL